VPRDGTIVPSWPRARSCRVYAWGVPRSASHNTRARSAKIVRGLRAALETGAERSYEELARAAQCSPRTVRKYLKDAPSTLGLEVATRRGPDREVLVRAIVQGAEDKTVEELATAVAREVLQPLFPIAGTELGRASGTGGLQRRL